MSDHANITRLTTSLFTGGDLPYNETKAAGHIAHWQDVGIATVIDCRDEWNDADLVADLAPEIRYVHAGIDDAGQRIPNLWFDQIVDSAELTPVGATTLVHCHMGINRGPSGAYALLLAAGHDPIDAIDLIRTRRPIAAVGYAEDALRWWHHRSSADTAKRGADRRRLAEWRSSHPHSTPRIIREIRASA